MALDTIAGEAIEDVLARQLRGALDAVVEPTAEHIAGLLSERARTEDDHSTSAAADPLPAPTCSVILTGEAAAILGLHPDTVAKRARPSHAGPSRRLHGHHSTDGTRGGRWEFRREVLDAYLAGANYPAQVRACGPYCCDAPANVAPLRRRRR